VDAEISVDQQKQGLGVQVGHGRGHGQAGGLQDVDAVDLTGIHHPDPDGPGSAGSREEPFTLAGVNCLESLTPPAAKSAGRITAAATTGPASGPRPASSTPAILAYPLAVNAFSMPRDPILRHDGGAA
jgi:hypothetical protein